MHFGNLSISYNIEDTSVQIKQQKFLIILFTKVIYFRLLNDLDQISLAHLKALTE